MIVLINSIFIASSNVDLYSLGFLGTLFYSYWLIHVVNRQSKEIVKLEDRIKYVEENYGYES